MVWEKRNQRKERRSKKPENNPRTPKTHYPKTLKLPKPTSQNPKTSKSTTLKAANQRWFGRKKSKKGSKEQETRKQP
jgi:hypothetical protein